MASLASWSVYDGDGLPVLGLTPTFVDYRTRAGDAVTQPTIVELGGGAYGFMPTDASETTGVVYLVDNGATATPRYVSGPVTTPALPFVVWHLEDGSGVLWTGAPATVGLYSSTVGSRTPPAVVAVRTYLFAITPSTTDLALDIAYRLDGPTGAWPAYLSGSVKGQPWVAPSPGPLKNPALDVVNFLDTKLADTVTLAKGTNLFVGPMRSGDRTPAPAVFALNTGGPGPMPYLSGGLRTALFRPTVQIIVRGPAGDIEAGEKLARGVFQWLHQHVLIGYLSVFARDSAPAYLGDDSDQHGQWAINIDCPYIASLTV